ncbi:MAG TPA: DUF5063 domain-containing protein [Thermoanaerobaculia bacterium]|nr:DUF5063 domain-containing protein [Thermoanaerobaculia bacterium]
MTDPAIFTFADVAREYCAWAEASPPARPEEDAATALRLLVALYAAALNLPEGEASEEGVASNSHEEWRRVYDRFTGLPVGNYWEVFNLLESSGEEPVLGSLADDLADIHRDLQRGLVLFERGEADAAAWEWSFHFRAHWGRHLTGALQALHVWWEGNYFTAPAR